MTRPLRVEFAGAFYHVINRGNNQDAIFKSNRDKAKFLEYLGKANERFAILIHTYCLMSNHYHLLLQTVEGNLSQAMQWINVSYASYFNRKYRRYGHLFQGRFKAILIDADEYLTHLSRYIHLNPVRANMVSNAADYRWSSYDCFIGKHKAPEFLETDRLLSYFGKGKKQAQRHFQSFVEGADIKAVENPGKQVTAGFILGGADFIEWVKKTFISGRLNENEIPVVKKLRPKLSPEKLVQAVCEELDCSPGSIIAKGRKKNKARTVAIYLAREMSGMPCKELGQYFGDVTGASITMTHRRISTEAQSDRDLRHTIDKIKKRIFNI